MSRTLRHQRILSHDGLWIDVQRVGPERAHPMLVCNGLGATLRDLRPLIYSAFDSLEVFGWDSRGFHRSEPPIDDSGWAFEHQVEDAAAVLALAGESVTVLGWSTGAATALALAARYPERVKRLVLICPVIPLDGYGPDWVRELAPALKRAHSLGSVWDVGVSLAGKSKLALKMAQQLRILSPTLGVEEWQSIALRLSGDAPDALAKTISALWEADLADMLPKVQAPTLVLGGRDDSAVPKAAIEHLVAHLPTATYHLLPLGTHSLPLELPDYVGLHCEEFFFRYPLAPLTLSA